MRRRRDVTTPNNESVCGSDQVLRLPRWGRDTTSNHSIDERLALGRGCRRVKTSDRATMYLDPSPAHSVKLGYDGGCAF